MQGYEDVTLYELSDEREQELLKKQIECNFIWTNKDGHGLGVIMNYVARNGSIWLTATSQRARIKALRRDPRASVVISSMGTDMGPGKQITYKGRVTIHDDQATKDWFYPAMGAIISPYRRRPWRRRSNTSIPRCALCWNWCRRKPSSSTATVFPRPPMTAQCRGTRSHKGAGPR